MPDLPSMFGALRKVMSPFAKDLVRVTDADSRLYLNTRKLQANTGGVSFHFMSIYTHPHLLRLASPALKKKMKGQSCFPFTAPYTVPVRDLARLTKAGFEEYRKAAHVSGLEPGKMCP